MIQRAYIIGSDGVYIHQLSPQIALTSKLERAKIFYDKGYENQQALVMIRNQPGMGDFIFITVDVEVILKTVRKEDN